MLRPQHLPGPPLSLCVCFLPILVPLRVREEPHTPSAEPVLQAPLCRGFFGELRPSCIRFPLSHKEQVCCACGCPVQAGSSLLLAVLRSTGLPVPMGCHLPRVYLLRFVADGGTEPIHADPIGFCLLLCSSLPSCSLEKQGITNNP